MGAALIRRVLVASAIAAPWLVWLPAVRSPGAIDVLGAVAIVGAFHGWGRLVARIARRPDCGTVLAIWWGIAATAALGGIAIALHLYDPRLLVIGGAVAHSADLALRASAVAESLELRAWRYAVVPWVLLVVLALVHVLGAAGATDTRPFDDDGHVIAQLRRLVDTGALADPIGYARATQLGGHAALAGLVGAFGDVRTARALDGGLGLALVLALVLSLVRPRDAAGAIWSTLLVVLASAFALHWTDLAPLWLAAGLLVALYVTLAEADAIVPVALVAGAAIVLRDELAAPALVLAAAAGWQARARRRDLLVLAGVVVAVVAPYLVARALAWSSVDPAARALLVPAHGGLVARLGIATLAALASAPLLLVPTRELAEPRLRWLAVAIAAGLGAIAGQLAVDRPFASHFTWVFAIAGFAVLVIELGLARGLTRVGLVVALLACVLVEDGRATAGRLAWSARYVELLESAEYARRAPAVADPYASIFAHVPVGDAVAVWVTRPETLDYAANRIVDLRTPRAARLRVPGPNDRRLDELVAASRARWLVLEADDEFTARANASWIYALACRRDFAWCADSLEALAFRHPVVAEQDGVRLVDLAR